MSHILVTGMTAQQCSASNNSRSLHFTGALVKALEAAGHTIFWSEPDIRWEKELLDQYDAIIVGVAPLTSVSANHAYGALSIIEMLYEDPRLRLVVDSPNPHLITNSLRSVIQNNNLVKDFYRLRKGFGQAARETPRLMKAVWALNSQPWPITMYPDLPWKGYAGWVGKMPPGFTSRLTGVNLDSLLIEFNQPMDNERVEKWSADAPTDSWTRRTRDNLSFPIVPLKWHKGWTDEQVFDQLQHTSGTLLAPANGSTGLWWSYRIAQSLMAFSPIVTEWRETGPLGEAWSYLGSTVEALSPDERIELSARQRDSYLGASFSPQIALETLDALLGLTRKAVPA